jgi:hypothetical protein
MAAPAMAGGPFSFEQRASVSAEHFVSPFR